PRAQVEPKPAQSLPDQPPKRTCGDCRVCCKLPDIPELGKPLDRWCQHVNLRRHAPGCSIYGSPDRPAACSAFQCGWLAGLGEEGDRPDKLGVLIQPTVQNGNENVLAFVEFRPGALASPRVQKILEAWAAYTGGNVVVRKASTPTFLSVPITINRVAV